MSWHRRIGHVLPRAAWEMHAELRAAQMARNDPAAQALEPGPLPRKVIAGLIAALCGPATSNRAALWLIRQ